MLFSWTVLTVALIVLTYTGIFLVWHSNKDLMKGGKASKMPKICHFVDVAFVVVISDINAYTLLVKKIYLE